MSKLKTVYGLTAINPERTEGWSKFFDTREEAELEQFHIAWETRVDKRTWEPEPEHVGDCGDDE